MPIISKIILFKEWMKTFVALITKLLRMNKKAAKNEWENDESDVFRALCSVYKKIRTILFHTYSLT